MNPLHLLLAGCAFAPPTPQPQRTPYLKLLGMAELPIDTPWGGTTVGGLSGIAYNPERGEYLLISDDRGNDGPQINGVSEILMEDAHHLLVPERSYSADAGFGARLYRIATANGSDTLALDALTPGNHRTAPKQLVGDLAGLGLTPDNIEGMTRGPCLPDGGCVLVFVADHNFNPAQVTQFIAARYLEPPGGSGRCPA